ncbi:hypothetical protein R1flu_000933 [Riccia fluitans]|uniref:Very-long-chain (3R)-3-hydroxyacyl-CoA dehydratase n=1 Tax=Riccia fluitans TaxID=41844 RepID=A0ABD1Y1U1_9MARC
MATPSIEVQEPQSGHQRKGKSSIRAASGSSHHPSFGVTPPLLTLIRYSTFFVLYPTGIFSETGLVYVALPFMKGSDLYSLRMPNKINFGFDYYYVSLLALGLYIPDTSL